MTDGAIPFSSLLEILSGPDAMFGRRSLITLKTSRPLKLTLEIAGAVGTTRITLCVREHSS